MTNLVVGSIGDVATRSKQSIAQTFLSCDVVVLCDTSGSMGSHDSHDGQSRYDRACWELAQLQATMPGKIGVISFSDSCLFCPNGTPLYLGGPTNLRDALRFAKSADVAGMRFIVISDGQPDDAEGALKVARTYQGRIDCIFVGPEGGHGQTFLERLAAASGGSHVTAEAAKQLAASVTKLLAAA